MHVVGTAGHVDHGKSTLVRALTGIDPDRLQEEKDRGMTIDLGFAWLTLPSGESISIVDVPGHERFIKNMLAGVGGIDLALLVVAADEGVMPQTVEHADILDLLRIRRVVVALTKTDLVEPDWLELARTDVQEFLERAGLPDAPIVPVSAFTGAGLPELVATIEASLDDLPPRVDASRPRVPIDRAFTITGFGTIVTGTLLGGQLRSGQEVELVPGPLRTRARSLQVHKSRVDTAAPGSRVAINIPGVATADITRGMVLTDPGWLVPTLAADVDLQVSRHADRPLLHGATLTFHSGSAEAEARVLFLQGDSIAPGERAWAQLRFAELMPLVKGDLFILRSPNATIGGGEVIDPQARRHRRRETGVAENLRVLREGTPDEIVAAEISVRGPIEIEALSRRVGITRDDLAEIVEGLKGNDDAIAFGDQVMSRERWERIAADLRARLDDFHVRNPLRPGMSRETARPATGLNARAYSAALARLVEERQIEDADGLIRRAGFRVTLTTEIEARAKRFIGRIAANPFTPPSLGELPADERPDAELARALADMGRIVLVADDIAYTPEAFEDMRRRVVERLHTNGKVTVADIRDQFGTSRKYVLALLEHLDRTHVTKRVGDDRVLA
ncbi:MAG: selenocysteine-specific translation elongation factor [Chloroflexota bacterium]|nr:MAG: selenocysteine-specific translation elongation factor [Chloroflexota bacterium]